MKAYILPSGEVLYPKRLDLPGVVGDGWDFAERNTQEYEQWEPFSTKAPPEVVALAMRLKRAGQQKT